MIGARCFSPENPGSPVQEQDMKTFLLLFGLSKPCACPGWCGAFPDATVAAWDSGEVMDGVISIPAELDRRLPELRAELVAWVHDLGCTEIGGRPLEAHLRAGDSLSMWWCSTLAEKHPKMTRHLFEALKLRVLEHLVEEQGAEHVILLTPRQGRSRTDGEPRIAMLCEALKGFCAASGRSFARLVTGQLSEKADPAPSSGNMRDLLETRLTHLYHALPAPLKAAVRFPLWWWRFRRKLPRTHLKPPVTDNAATIVTYFPNIDMTAASAGRFRSRYWETLHDLLAPPPGQPHRVNWVFIHFPAPQYTLAQMLALRDRFRSEGRDGASFHFLEEFLLPGDLFRALLRFIRLLAAGLRVEKTVRRHFFFKGSKMDLWPFLGENWADSTRGWRALERCLMALAFRRHVAWAGPQAWFLFPQENCPWERMLAQAAHEAGAGPVYGAQHSTVRPADFRYFDDPRLLNDPSCSGAMPDLWLCNGSGARDALLEAGFPASRLHLVEALRYLYLAGTENGTETEATENASEADRRPDRSYRLLLVTSFFADETDAHLAVLAAAARSGILDGWEIVVKPHPYLPVAERLARLFPVLAPADMAAASIPRVEEGPIGTFLTPGTVVWASNSTTVALEAAWRRLPVLVQAPYNDLNLSPLQNIPGVCIIHGVKDLAEALARPSAPALPSDYFILDPDLPRWRALLETGIKGVPNATQTRFGDKTCRGRM